MSGQPPEQIVLYLLITAQAVQERARQLCDRSHQLRQEAEELCAASRVIWERCREQCRQLRPD